MEMTRRRNLILDAVVRLYSESGQPVSSGLVVRWLGGGVSSATVRAEMGRLEADGLLVKPHASAGRVPTDAGYRAFVNRIMTEWPGLGDPRADEVRQMVDRELQQAAGTHVMVRSLAGLLCRLTAGIGIILGPTWDDVRALRVELHPREGRRVLMVLVLENALVRTLTVALDREWPPLVLEDAARVLSERISGRTIGEIRSGVLPALDPAASPACDCASDIASRGEELFADVEEAEIEMTGVANVLDEPEFSEADRLKTLIRFLESPRTIRDVLQRLSPSGREQIAVWIGSENPVAELRPFSLVLAPYDMTGRKGVLAVLGLRRMPYDRTIAGLNALARSLRTMG